MRERMGAPDVLHGIDVSSYQGDVRPIDWPAVAASGVSFAAVKLTEGLTRIDRDGRANLAGARNAGLRVIAYHFLVPGSPEAQARHLFDSAPPDMAAVEPLLLAIDVERGPAGSPSAQDALAFARCIEARSGTPPLLYTGPAYALVDRMADVPELAAFPLWLADWNKVPAVPRPWSSWQVWQTGLGPCPGVHGLCDLDVAEALP